MRFDLLLEFLSVTVHGQIPTAGGDAPGIHCAQSFPLGNMDVTAVTEPHSKPGLHFHELQRRRELVLRFRGAPVRRRGVPPEQMVLRCTQSRAWRSRGNRERTAAAIGCLRMRSGLRRPGLPGGGWAVSRDIWNSDQPLPAMR
jgi:hypothetical protein